MKNCQTEIKIAVQTENFDQNDIYRWVSASNQSGAVVLFIGKVREMNLGDQVSSLYLEHYPAMTEKALHNIVVKATQRWQLQRVCVVHRVGQLNSGDEIVLVATSSAHRESAYQANQFIMDYLKTKAPFWKKEQVGNQQRWVASRESDQLAIQKWQD
ncbi:molybdenum cofactor biosynthesis protein MoaE [Mergibacter septicus]|uniref:Molybdopterin synthase catalytic subunit n=1 Tax=Mergibacter septicus TaxID=221402 RepID=A0A8E3MCK6_9PAST|nr:molybdopterin synthase catalytic subunit MoaE [Mergibacter septicus]AWX13351.1 molybdenum cofactor biosynthesis protein MoaE [Mergibacter septicus]AWX15297.1 molybdenum cofactor biosynthesis protein MoaE [Mergibacter septicus]QDJ12774.1 molybdenum cofactor biosynthesis protein MoaE [Mergibacter septicus]QDJ14551.1 molybdenum cofactor biosynthesis protein MoaE [Mergibacter septicus]UTU48013.1 molybdopterin synthase catalytic subunit MoaE [Mergibacter septicus]